ncbi:MAG: hypothetical protein PHQ66_02465 [Candidatus Nanoarchaeia archaeon]|nr:hypothetical protein [Candidatus Nanoarchaeia archaeon]MDD5357769.1 hypothetical protein [Candidatus Nanoarchaeia archaeon]MDD5588688.1 hypothetical protein [Candidatus Nanoarchaeia archaeon]
MLENLEPNEIENISEEKKEEVINENKRTRQSRDTKFPLPDGRSSVEKQIKILKALNISSNKGKNPVSAKDVAPITGMHFTIVSGALAFFQKINMLIAEKNYTYLPTKETIEFCNELEWNSEGAGEFFKKIILPTWFGEYTLKLFKLQPEMNEEELISSLGKYCEADKTYHQTALSQLITYLEYANILEFDETTKKYKLSDSNLSLKSEEIKSIQENKNVKNLAIEKNEISPTSTQIKLPDLLKSNYPFIFNINLEIDEKSDVIIISKKVAELIKELKSLGEDGRASNS